MLFHFVFEENHNFASMWTWFSGAGYIWLTSQRQDRTSGSKYVPQEVSMALKT